MACNADLLRHVPLFALLDEEESSVLANHVEIREFTAHQRIYRIGDPGGRAYILIDGKVHVSTIDDDNQELTVDEPEAGGFFGFASLLDGTPHQTTAVALEPTTCIEVDRSDLETLIRKKPDAGLDMLAVLGKQFHVAQHLLRTRSLRNPNDLIEERQTFGDSMADKLTQVGGSWRFIITSLMVVIGYTAANVLLGQQAWDPYPYILLNLLLSLLAAIQAPVIMMSQNRQDAKDRLRSELDFEVNKRAELEIRGLARQVHEIGDKVNDIEELLGRDSGRRS